MWSTRQEATGIKLESKLQEILSLKDGEDLGEVKNSYFKIEGQ
jgi:hypothetical protein